MEFRGLLASLGDPAMTNRRGNLDDLRNARLSHACRAGCRLCSSASRTLTLKLWDKHGIKQAGFWTTLIGDSNQELTYLLAWESLADREKKWNAFMGDPAWISARAESEKDGPILANASNQILQPTAFSAVK